LQFFHPQNFFSCLDGDDQRCAGHSWLYHRRDWGCVIADQKANQLLLEELISFLDEAHHLLMGPDGTQGSTLQEQLEWLKSLSKTGILYILVGTYDLCST
jgi:hypothetical protein